MSFPAFQKIPRLHKPVVVTEKIDGTNGLIAVYGATDPIPEGVKFYAVDEFLVAAGSRNRWVDPTNDNYGFGQWVWEFAGELVKLGPGLHYGEWWGRGIQRGYEQTRKRFSLFNTARWRDPDSRPACCDVVPVLAEGDGEQMNFLVRDALLDLMANGSVAAPGFMKPEGVVVYHTAANTLFKVPFELAHKGALTAKSPQEARAKAFALAA